MKLSVPSFFLLERFQQISVGNLFTPHLLKIRFSVNSVGLWIFTSIRKRGHLGVSVGSNSGVKNLGKSELDTDSPRDQEGEAE